MNEILRNFKDVIEEAFLVKKLERKIDKEYKDCLDIMRDMAANDETLSNNYKKVFYFLDFDGFARTKELYSSLVYKFIPSWDEYFSNNNMRYERKENNIFLYFLNIKKARSQRDNKIRSPYYITLDDIDYAEYYKLFKYLLIKKFTTEDRFNVTKYSKFAQKAAIETNTAYVIISHHRIKNIQQCINSMHEEGIKYLVRDLEIKPTWEQLNKIEKLFPFDIFEMVTYYFE